MLKLFKGEKKIPVDRNKAKKIYFIFNLELGLMKQIKSYYCNDIVGFDAFVKQFTQWDLLQIIIRNVDVMTMWVKAHNRATKSLLCSENYITFL